MSILTAERLVKLAYKYPSLHTTWYLVACACLTVINQPGEIPKIYHFALRQQLLEYSADSSLLTDKYMLALAQDSISSSAKYEDLTAVGVNLPDVLIPYSYYDKLPLAYKFSKGDDIHATQMNISSKLREVILKTSALAGLPKSINALTILKTVTPTSMRPAGQPMRRLHVNPGHVASSSLVEEDVIGTKFESDDNDGTGCKDTVDGPISPVSVNSKQIHSDLVRGSRFWEAIYSKISTRVRRQMINAYPDLWYHAYHNVYGPLLSYTDVLNAKETSMCVVASLIPQDVNPQLKGHLKGAMNVGATKEELNDVRQVVFDLCDWTGGVSWAGGKEAVAKL
ncbi:hypothetical protein PGUG_01703 [Meyerozyma guilliermondii ATCC 6260]|uniref:Carboxymuconolactone decarboxylase-like domain-containing protein n=1 Tax=Meyerozyma guilliermondii (strain ATCC 6260 / CBS 566 / DSM 6381 / JCM 1539 / NBRC 10279 / NRRL Y-324) TaxID=294746 RepID=A5DEK2_PICGU|nr:uncharacterized protein PGUG_01703 [Meyerozyma guilliermondii ATCC 6260]EDK37605.2 hypothetical protein PGUG_01703 [Meyerozyma guilliermondii ATCC 6260]